MQGLRDDFTVCEMTMQGLHDDFTVCETTMQGLRDDFTVCEATMQDLHSGFIVITTQGGHKARPYYPRAYTMRPYIKQQWNTYQTSSFGSPMGC